MGARNKLNDAELRKVLSRAAEIDVGLLNRTGLPSAGAEYGPQDAERLAAEAGISADAVRTAIDELYGGERSAAGYRGGRRFIIETKMISKARSNEATLRQLAEAIDDFAGLGGATRGSAAGLVWRTDAMESMRSGIRYQLKVRPVANGTELRASADLRGAAGGIFGGIMGGLGLGAGMGVGFGVGLGALNSAAFAVLVPLAFVGLSYLIARGAYRAVAAAARRRLDGIIDEAQAAIESGP